MKHAIKSRMSLASVALALGSHSARAAEPASVRPSEPIAVDRADVSKLPNLQAGAEKGLVRYRELALHDSSLANSASPRGISTGTPLREYLVRLDSLRSFPPKGNPEALLVDTKVVHYPVLVDGKVSGDVSLVQQGADWNVVSLGDGHLAELRQAAVAGSVKKFALRESDHFLVRVPALNLEFVGFYNKGALYLESVTDDAPASLKAGVAEPAVQVFARLVPLAKAHNGLPS
jgi:hypothetical protein